MKVLRLYRLVIAIGLVCAIASGGASVAAQESSGSSISASVSTFATGLMFPRGLKFGPDGYLYVAEAGPGGDAPNNGTCEGYTSPFTPYHPGLTARASKISPEGVRSTVVDKLPSARDNTGESLGANDVAFVGDTLYILNSAGGCSRGLAETPAGIYKANPDGTWTLFADFSAYLSTNPTAQPSTPDDWEPDGSVYNMIEVDGKLYVVEANHGELDEVAADGSIRRLLDISATEGPNTPTALTFNAGDFYAGNLSTFPINRGASKLYKISPDGQLSVYAQGLTAVLGVAFDGQGQLYALETTVVDNDFPQPGTGRVVRVAPDGGLEVVASGLSFPTGMTFGPDGMLYVSNFGYGGDPSLGEIVRVDVNPPLAAPVGAGMPRTGTGSPSDPLVVWLLLFAAGLATIAGWKLRKRVTA